MKILAATENLSQNIQSFILPHEQFCVQLANYVRKSADNLYVIFEGEDITDQNNYLGIFYFNGSLLHCIPDLKKIDFLEFSKVFLDFIKENNINIKCVIGEQNASEFLISVLKEISHIPLQTFNYNLMTLQENPLPPPGPLSCDDYIKRCTEDDLESLVEIQKKYLIKEVAPAGKQISDLEVSVSLRQILKNQLTLALLTDEEIVAKANSNAIGWNWVQIGGVFTHPLYRRNSYAWHLVFNLCQRIRKTQKGICLFVKEKNNPAIELYSKIGFTTCGKYSISYF